MGGPENHAPAGMQRALDALNAGFCVEPLVDILDERIRPVVHIEKDRVVAVGPATIDEIINITNLDPHPRVIQKFAIHFMQEFTVPGDDLRKQLGHVHPRVGTGEFEHALEREAEAEPADKHPRFPRQMMAGKFGHLFLGGGSSGAHQL